MLGGSTLGNTPLEGKNIPKKNNQPIVHLVTDNEATGQTKELFNQMIENVGKVPKWMRVMANCENTLISFFQLFKSLMDNKPAPQLLK